MEEEIIIAVAGSPLLLDVPSKIIHAKKSAAWHNVAVDEVETLHRKCLVVYFQNACSEAILV